MKEVLANILVKIKSKGNAIADLSYLMDNSWFIITEEVITKKTIYIFRQNGELLISEDGDVSRAKWENLVHSTNSVILEINGKITLFNIVYLTSEYLILQKDGGKELRVFIKQKRYQSKIPKNFYNETIDFVYHDLNSLLNDNNSTVYNTQETSLQERNNIIDGKNKSIKEPTLNTEEQCQTKSDNIVFHTNTQELSKVFKEEEPSSQSGIEYCDENDFKLQKTDGKWGYLDKHNNVVIEYKYDDAFPFFEGLACVQIDGKKGFINRNGEYVISPQFDSTTYFKNGKSTVTIGESTFDIDSKGNRLN